jgi:hypothetical protein
MKVLEAVLFFLYRKVYGECASKFSRRKRREPSNIKKVIFVVLGGFYL